MFHIGMRLVALPAFIVLLVVNSTVSANYYAVPHVPHWDRISADAFGLGVDQVQLHRMRFRSTAARGAHMADPPEGLPEHLLVTPFLCASHIF